MNNTKPPIRLFCIQCHRFAGEDQAAADLKIEAGGSKGDGRSSERQRTGSCIGLRRVRPELPGFPGSSQPSATRPGKSLASCNIPYTANTSTREWRPWSLKGTSGRVSPAGRNGPSTRVARGSALRGRHLAGRGSCFGTAGCVSREAAARVTAASSRRPIGCLVPQGSETRGRRWDHW
jgi:hypothetical protein